MYLTSDELGRRFNYHPPPDDETAERHAQVRAVLFNAAEELVALTGAESREQSLTITSLEKAMFWANAAIAREIRSPV